MPYKIASTGKLGFEFTSSYSSVVDTTLLNSLKHAWSSEDSVLNKRLNDAGSVSSFKLTPEDLIMERTYPVQMDITNPQNSFLTTSNINFVPNIC